VKATAELLSVICFRNVSNRALFLSGSAVDLMELSLKVNNKDEDVQSKVKKLISILLL
jgi:hypothetical protein